MEGLGRGGGHLWFLTPFRALGVPWIMPKVPSGISPGSSTQPGAEVTPELIQFILTTSRGTSRYPRSLQALPELSSGREFHSSPGSDPEAPFCL